MTFEHFLTDPLADHPVVNRKTVCFGGGGGGGQAFQVGNAPNVPDYSQYIEAMTKVGNKLTGYGDDLYKWAQDAGVKVSGIADTVSARAGELADAGAGTYKEMMSKWKDTYGDLYDKQAAEARRMIGDLPAVKEQEAGRYQADVAQAFDASREANERSLRSYGLKAPGSGAQRLDQMVSNQRGLAQVAAGEQGRRAAVDTAWKRVGEAQEAGKIMPQIAGQGSSLALAAGNQEVGAPQSAISTTVGAYAPSNAAYNAAYPWMKQWGDTTATGYNQQLAGYSAHTNAALKAHQMSQEADSGGDGMMGMLGGLAGTVAGSFMGPVGGAVGGAVGKSLGSAFAEKGGYIDPARHRFAEGGNVTDVEDLNAEGGDQVVTPDMSGSQGAITDDVPARLNVGEFVFPKDVVAWRGEAWMQKEIMKARKEREAQTVAEPEMAPASAIDAQAPQFQSAEAPL